MRLDPKLESTSAGRAFQDVHDRVTRPSVAREDLIQRTRSAYQPKDSFIDRLKDLSDEVPVFVA